MRTTEIGTRNARRRSGNILVITCVSFALIALALMIGYSFAGLFFVNNRLQAACDEIALIGAKKLNERDRIGQMNNMVARCRQLVFSSRRDLENTKQAFPDLEDFAEPLLTEAQESAQDLEAERKRVAALARSESTNAMKDRFNQLWPSFKMTLPWLKVNKPNFMYYNVGKAEGIECNVEELKAFQDLKTNDESQGYVNLKPAPGLQLYKADVPGGMRLPGADSNLPFYLSSLPAPVERTIAPARIILPQHIKVAPTDSIPSAAGVMMQIKVETGLGFKASGLMTTRAAAETTGACLQQ